MKLSSFFLALCTLPFLISCAKKNVSQFDLAILNGSTIDLRTGEILFQDLFIKEGRIAEVHPKGTRMDYSATEVVDASDSYILPGFWDNHVHFRGGDSLLMENKNLLNLFLANGITTVREAGGDLTPQIMQWQEEIGKGTLKGPTIFTSGPKLDGANATWAGSLVVEEKADIAPALDSLQALGTDFAKLYDSTISGEMFLETLREAHKRGIITSGHMPFSVTLEETVQAGIGAVEHLYYIMKGCSAKEAEVTGMLNRKEIGFWEAMPLLRESYSPETASNTFAMLRENKVFVVPTLHIGSVLASLKDTDRSNDPYLKYLGPRFIDTYQGRLNAALKASDGATLERKELSKFFHGLVGSLQKADVSLLAGSDSGAFNSFTYPGISLHAELEAMVKAGLSPLQALRTSAYNGAEFLKKEKDYGTISKDKIADLVILEADPLEDITNTQRINAVVKQGVPFTKKQVRALWQTAIWQE
tara:strand:+ start:101651 stop:103072 length:1422 start_codon:yes stop_codon:yes gene_type:complete